MNLRDGITNNPNSVNLHFNGNWTDKFSKRL